jgi:tetratricopeptide (TPR) repeat protein
MRPRYVFSALLACLLSPAWTLTAQSAAKQPDLSGEGAVIEQMHTVIHVARDGSSLRTFEMKARVLSDAGLRDAGTVAIPYSSMRETVTIDYARVRKPDGKLVETPADDAQEVPLPVTQQAPMYSDLRSKQLPVRSLGVGDTLEYKLTIQEKNSDAPGSYWRTMNFAEGLPVRQETVELRVPRTMTLTVKSKKVQPAISEEGEERVYRWTHETASEYPKKKEKDAAPVALVAPLYEPDIAVTSYRSWAEFGAWYQGLMKDRAVPDAAIQAKADELTKGLSTDEEKIEALYHYVATQFRYISVSLGIGQVQPHTAAEVFRNQYGDCKDKHTLLQAMLTAEKIEAEPVLIGSAVRLNESLPMPSQFDHMITLVKPGPHEIWLDTTPEVAPSRVLLAPLRGRQALAVPLAGEAHVVTTPAALPFPNYYRQTVTATLDAAGTLTGHFDTTARGDLEVALRAAFHIVPRAKWTELEQNISYQSGFSGEVSAADAALPEKTQDPFHVSWDYTRKEFGDWPNRSIPGLSPGFGSNLSADTKPPERAMQLDGDMVRESKATLTLPAGYSMIPPDDVKRVTPFAEYTSTYVLKGRTLEMNRRLAYKVRELPASEWTAYREFEKAVSDDAGQMMQLFSSESKPDAAKTGSASSDGEARGLLVLAEERMKNNDLKGAEQLLDQAEKRSASVMGLQAERGQLEARKNNMAGAIAAYRKEIEAHPEFQWAYGVLATAYGRDGQFAQAEETLRAWNKVAPKDAQPKVRLAQELMTEEHYKDAAAMYAEAIGLSAKPEPLKISLGIAQLKAGDTEAGKATLHAVMDHSEDAIALNSASYALADADLDLSADESAAQKAVTLLERRSNATQVATASKEDMANVLALAATWDTLGWIDLKEKKLAEAESYVYSAWMLRPDANEGLHLGRIYEDEGKKPEALAAYRLGAKMLSAPHLTPASARLKQQMEDRVEALKAEGIREKVIAKTQPGGDELGAMRTYTVPSPLKGEYASADFLLLLGDNHAEEVRFLKGAESLRAAEPLLAKAEYHAPLPTGSHARILRRGILACTTGSKECVLVLLPPGEAGVE